MTEPSKVFLGSAALAAGLVTRHDLRVFHRRLLPDVYLPKGAELDPFDRAVAAQLWSGQRGVVTGVAASALHGARWVQASDPVELNLDNARSHTGLIVRSETLLADEITCIQGIPVTTIERTAFDLARRGPVDKAIERLDALAAATGFKPERVLELVERHPHVMGLRRVADVLDLVDAGAQSPKETWLRLLLIDEGFPRPQTQIPILGPDGYPIYFLDMGWEEVLCAAEYDGEQHRLERSQYRGDITRSEYVEGLGWRRVRVLAGDSRASVVQRIERAGAPPRIAAKGVLKAKFQGRRGA